MENTKKLQITCFLFLLLILQQQVVFVEGRNLRSHLCRDCSKMHKKSNINHEGRRRRSSRRVEYEVDNFRPTSPGHSPGVGHSINN
jgi:hypothetical protein